MRALFVLRLLLGINESGRGPHSRWIRLAGGFRLARFGEPRLAGSVGCGRPQDACHGVDSGALSGSQSSGYLEEKRGLRSIFAPPRPERCWARALRRVDPARRLNQPGVQGFLRYRTMRFSSIAPAVRDCKQSGGGDCAVKFFILRFWGLHRECLCRNP
jgi:hypothetical protein